MTAAIQLIRRHQVSVLAVCLILMIGILGIWTWSQDRKDPRVEAIRTKGYPTTLTELSNYYPAVPAESNAALTCLRAFDLPAFPGNANEKTELLEKDWLPEPGGSLSEDEADELQVLMDNAAPALDLLHSLPAEPMSRYPIDFSAGFACLLPHLGKFKYSVRLLGAEAILHSHRGDIDKAVEALLAANRVTATLAPEPLLISHLVRIACRSIVVRHVEVLVNAQRLDVQHLTELNEALSRANHEQGLRRALAAERVFGLSVLYDTRQAQAVIFGTGGNPPAKTDFRSWALMSALKTSGLLAKDRKYYLDRMDEYLTAAEAPFPERFEFGVLAATNIAPSKLMIFSRMLLPALSRTVTKDTEDTARLRTAQTALAIEAYQRTHEERLPVTLEDALGVPRGTSAEDPFTGEALRYKQLGKGYVVYSVGSDRIDNGGGPPPKTGKSNSNPPEVDIRFTVARR